MAFCLVVMGIGLIGFWVCKKTNRKEWQKSFLFCMGVAVLAFIVGMSEKEEGVLHEGRYLIRHPAGGGAYEAELILGIEQMEERSFHIQVPEQLLTAEEEMQYLEAAIDELEKEVKGENSSLDKIYGHLKIRETYQHGMVSAVWNFSNPELVQRDGLINEEALMMDGEEVYATITLTCRERSLLHCIGFKVYRREKSEDEILNEKIQAIILENGANVGTEFLQLPQEVEGHSLSWKTVETKTSQQILWLGILVSLLLPELERERLREQKKKREEELLQGYPEMVNKLTILLGAGMTVQAAWYRITDMYLAARKEGKISRNEVYEEMLITRHEIESGRGEIRSYEAFGERCGLPRFRKFTNYLVQNIKKGSLGICDLLEKEAIEVFIEKRNKARRCGEEATTKLLLPMLLMLGIVIFIIMIPALISFQMGT